MGNQIKCAMTFLGRLRRNQAGNTLAMVAAAILPLAGLIGGGVDMSRAYMVRARLQQACDAAALAGRRAMTTASMTDSDKTEAKKFFDFNFPQNTFGAADFTPTIQSKPGETTTVQVSAATTIPTTIMRIFGVQTLALSVNCDSRFDIGNTDVMLVLDTTGSMKDSISNGSGGSSTKLAALQQAVKDFYDTLGPGSDSTGRIRYGFMPYSSTVNVGKLLPASYVLGGTTGETWKYQTRQGKYDGYNTTSDSGSWTYKSGTATNGSGNTTGTSSNNCAAIPSDNATQATNSSTSSSTDANGVITTTVTYTRTTNGSTYAKNGSCTGSRSNGYKQYYTSVTYANYVETKTDKTVQTPKWVWTYNQYDVDVTGFASGKATANPAYSVNDNSAGLSPTSTWSGCIEERDTDSTITKDTSTASIPSGAYDLQIDALPSSTETKWRPHWPDIIFSRSSTASSTSGNWLNSASNISNGWVACPSEARKLTSYASRTAVPTGQTSSYDSYVNSLVAIGGTYHDTGMIWGARFLSPTGIFASDNGAAPNGFNVSRHIVFMTDGTMSAYSAVYGAWGYQALDRRDAPSSINDTDLTAIHKRRLEMMCNAIKSKGIVIWVIGFSDKDVMGTELQNCASSANHWSMNYTAADLKTTFQNIAKNIGGLRLSN
ncbi:pilus assembly protein TadG-related protein [Sphingobium sp. AP49]|uniref:TadE/TadG family type IV pilus assembly protein n=1 Tax=Sphingobium sp. AP49 TaxID=1144307 RepID=UPI00026EC8F4|nr:TadE/TadG family type IV pilus assembly protein [Sphingobium sp. AP49]WHO40652.1 pilus assembly protein TadG-related protein [Sphingobium sp. AP49]